MAFPEEISQIYAIFFGLRRNIDAARHPSPTASITLESMPAAFRSVGVEQPRLGADEG